MKRLDTNRVTDAEGNLLREEVVEVDVPEDEVEDAIRDQLAKVMQANRDFVTATGLTNADVVKQVKALTVQVNRVIRVVARLLDEVD